MTTTSYAAAFNPLGRKQSDEKIKQGCKLATGSTSNHLAKAPGGAANTGAK